MIAIRVYARKEGVATWSEIVPLQDQTFSLSKKLIDLNEIGSLRCESSKTLLFPSEFDLNNTFFGNFKSFTSGTFNAFEFYEAKVELLDNSIVLEGSLYFKGYNRANRCYEVNIASKVGTLKSRLEAQTLGDLRSDLLALYDHTYAWDTIKTMFTTRLNNRVAYAAVDNGVGLGDGWNLNTTATSMSKLFYPMINLKQAVADIFDHLDIGFSDDTQIDDSAMVCIGGSKDTLAKLRDSGMEKLVSVINGSYVANKIPILFNNPYPEYGELIITDPLTGHFTVSKSGTYYIHVLMGYRYAPSTYSSTIEITSTNSGTMFVHSFDIIAAPYDQITEFDAVLVLNAGSDYYMTIKMPNDPTYSIEMGVEYTSTGYPLVIDLLKKVKLIDLIQMYRNEYDVYYVQQGSGIKAYTYKSLLAASNPNVITSYIEYKSGVAYNSLINFISSRYRYLKATTKDYFSNKALQSDGVPIGSLDMGLPISSQLPTQEVKLLTTTWVNFVDGDLQFAKNYSELGKIQANDLPMYLAFFIGGKTVASYKILDEANIERTHTVWPIFDNTKGGQMLSFNRIDLYEGNADNSTAKSLFETYHAPKFTEWIGLTVVNGVDVAINSTDLSESRLVECDAWINATGFKSYKLGELVSFVTPEGGIVYGRFLEITNFDMSGRKPCKLKIIRRVKLL